MFRKKIKKIIFEKKLYMANYNLNIKFRTTKILIKESRNKQK